MITYVDNYWSPPQSSKSKHKMVHSLTGLSTTGGPPQDKVVEPAPPTSIPAKSLPSNKSKTIKADDIPKHTPPPKPTAPPTAGKRKRVVKDDFDAYEDDAFWGSDHICWSGYNTKSDTNSDAYKAASPS